MTAVAGMKRANSKTQNFGGKNKNRLISTSQHFGSYIHNYKYMYKIYTHAYV